MNIFRILVLSILLTGQSFQSLAQEEKPKLSLDEGSIDSQFEYVIKESNNYQQFEVIPSTWMVKLRTHVNDSINEFQGEMSSLQSELSSRQQRIDELTAQLESTKDTLANTRSAQDEMAFLGISMGKSSYRLIIWSIIGVLFILLLIFIIRFNRSNVVTRESREALATVQEDFDQHRKRSLEREQKLRRELQDELNKQRRQKP